MTVNINLNITINQTNQDHPHQISGPATEPKSLTKPQDSNHESNAGLKIAEDQSTILDESIVVEKENPTQSKAKNTLMTGNTVVS